MDCRPAGPGPGVEGQQAPHMGCHEFEHPSHGRVLRLAYGHRIRDDGCAIGDHQGIGVAAVRARKVSRASNPRTISASPGR